MVNKCEIPTTEERTTPVPSASRTGDVSVVFVCDSKFVTDQANFKGEMVVCGKVMHKIQKGESIDLLDLIGMPSQNELSELYTSLRERKSSEIEALNSEIAALQASRKLAKPEPEQVDWFTGLLRWIVGYERQQREKREKQERERQEREKASQEKKQQAIQEQRRIEEEWERITWEDTVVPSPALIVAPLAVYT